MKKRIAIGPLSNPYGAVGRITKTISQYSRNEVVPFVPPYYNDFATRIWRKTGFKIYDPYGFYLSHYHLQNFDIIHFMNHPVYREVHIRPKNPIAKYVYRISGLYKTYVRRHDPNYGMLKKLDEWMIESCRQCEKVIVGNKWFKDYLMHNYNLDSLIIPNGVVTKKWVSGSKERFEKNFGIESGFCLYAGRLSKEKGPEFFLEVAKKMPNIVFVMIGPSVTVEAVSRFVKDELPNNVHCLNRLFGSDLSDCFSSAGILLNPAKSKFGGNVILEAMASKTIPLVAVEESNDITWFEPFSEGLTYEHNNVEDCLEKINYALANQDIALNAYRKILLDYDWSIIIKKYDDLYESIC